MPFAKELAGRYWQMVIPSIAATAVGVLLPGDYPPVVRILVVALLVLTFASGRLYQDRWAQKRSQLQLLHERVLSVARDFKYFLSGSESHTRDVSVFLAAAQLQADPKNTQLIADWAYGMSEARSLLDNWHYSLIKNLELDQAERRYSTERLRLALQSLSNLAVLHENSIESFRRVCHRSDVSVTRPVGDKFDRMPPEYNLWVQQFRVLCSDVKQVLGGTFQPFSLKPQSPLGMAFWG